MRVGLGYDIHRLAPGRPLMLGGVEIPSDRGEQGFSDGDALIHALIDALLGPANWATSAATSLRAGRICGESRASCSARTAAMLREAGWRVGNVDCVVVLESPRILPHIGAIRAALARELRLPVERVTVKGKTREGLGEVGAGAAVEAHAVALIEECGK